MMKKTNLSSISCQAFVLIPVSTWPERSRE